MNIKMVGWNWDEDEAPESNDNDGDFVPPLDGDDDWEEDEQAD